jgi:hypothetical protein
VLLKVSVVAQPAHINQRIGLLLLVSVLHSCSACLANART